MKLIRFFIMSKRESVNNSGEVEMVDALTGVEMPYSEENLAVAQAKACNGEYSVEDDGRTVPESADNVLNVLLGVIL